MTFPETDAPPFSPFFLLGISLPPFSGLIIQHLLDHAVRRLRIAHPDLLDRLADVAPVTFLINPTDLPFAVELMITTSTIAASVVDGPGPEVTAKIHGPTARLIEMLEGSADGDALFFSRALRIEGSTEAVLALRNAMDGSTIDLLADLTDNFGPLRTPARQVWGLLQPVTRRLQKDFGIIHTSILAPLGRRIDGQTRRINTLEDRLTQAENRLKRKHAT